MSGPMPCCGARAGGFHAFGCEDAAAYAAEIEREETAAWETDRLMEDAA